VPPSYSVALGIAVASSNSGASPSAHPDQETAGAGATSGPLFVKEEEIAAATATIAAITRLVRDPKVAPTPASLQRPEVQLRLLEDVRSRLSGSQLAVHPELGLMTDRQLAHIVCEVTAVFATKTIAIPRVMVLPQGEVRTGVQDFTLDLSGIQFSPVAQSILIQHLNSDFRERIDGRVENNPEVRLEDYVVRGLIDFDDVSYDDQADLLYKLAGEVVAHLRTYLKEEEEVRNVLLFHAKPIAAIVHAQMHAHAWEEASSYESIVVQGFSEMQEQAFAASAGESVRPFDHPLDNKVAIRNMLFGGFEKCIYATQKFDSDTERRFTVVLEQDPTVLKWLKPGKRVFQIRLPEGAEYEPDFVVETATEKLICEPKAADRMEEPTVLEKAQAAARWCEHATVFEMANGGKPWRYLLIPHDAIADNMTLDGLAQRFTVAAQPRDRR
jgi:type III restriction enzyme